MGISPDGLPGYAELHCLSSFSFLRGASQPEELVERAAQLGYAALAITDECSLAGIVRAHVAAKDARLKLIAGSELRLEDGPKLVLLAPDRAAYGALAALITAARRRAKKGSYALFRRDLETDLKGLLALCLPETEADAAWVKERFPDRSWMVVELHHGSNELEKLKRINNISRRSGLPLVAASDVHMHLRSRRRLQDALTAIRLGRPVAECGHALHPNGERHLRLRARLAQLYPPALLEETLRIAGRCRPFLDELRYEYPEEIVPPGQAPAAHLRELAFEGLRRRYPADPPAAVVQMVERELALIADLGYEAFFLTVHDVVRYARSRGILCQGRGSAANSAVCYCLGITEVNPENGNVLFERFLSKERGEPPDIDVDFEHERREEVIQYLYGKYGRERAALAATVISYRPKSALRDLSKVLKVECNFSKLLSWWEGDSVLPERLREADLDPEDPRIRQLLELTRQLIGFPRHLSQHVGGFVISRGPLAELVPVENAAMPERTVIQWDKNDLEAMGLLKVDVLALGMLTALRRALALAGIAKLQDIPEGDPRVYAMIQKADTVGVFQIESRAQMSMLPRLKPANFYDLVIEVAIVRPGPIQGDMVHPYLRRRQGLEKVEYPTEAVKGALERTLGVPIFQEQVMQLAIVAAGFTPGEADQLRRAMATWQKKGGLKQFEAKLKDGMRERGYAPEFAERIYQQIHGFSDYGFPESHSASFAQLAYFSAWLKCHRPAAFLAALLNSQPMGFYSPSQLIQDARRHGVQLRPADVSLSDWDCTLEEGAVRLGLRMVGGLGEDAGRRIAACRPSGSVAELAQRAALGRKELNSLAAAGALQSLAGHRRNARWAAAGAESRPPMHAPVAERAPAFAEPGEAEEIAADYASLGLTLGRHPLALLRTHLRSLKMANADEISLLPHGSQVRTAGLVTCRQRPGTATGVVFVTLEDESGCVNVIVWSRLFERYRRELLGARLLGVEGTLESSQGVVHLIARRCTDHSAWLGRLLGPLEVRSHDFH
ncbi:MAG TPA: error-prone DNA polymerase [Burkholderiales bacterium]|nr:error-prone DNA polymerase [Burkholderiales bacterium]